jgi:hypothetical protein
MATATKRLNGSFTEKSQVFWGEIAPSEHLLQIYENDAEFLRALGQFVSAGFRSNESVVIISTAWHLNALEKQLVAFDTNALRASNQYIPLDAEETLSEFMVDNWPDEKRFQKCVTQILQRAGKNGRRVRAFGEMVALLWANGHDGATFHLEYLWHQLQKRQAFSLFCAYPKKGFRENSSSAVQKICDAHSKMVPCCLDQ